MEPTRTPYVPPAIDDLGHIAALTAGSQEEIAEFCSGPLDDFEQNLCDALQGGAPIFPPPN